MGREVLYDERNGRVVTGRLALPGVMMPSNGVMLGDDRLIVLLLSQPMDASLTYTVDDLASDEAVRLRCDCRVRTYRRAELAALVGWDARLHLVGLHRELWCGACGEPPFTGWVVVVAAVPGRS